MLLFLYLWELMIYQFRPVALWWLHFVLRSAYHRNATEFGQKNYGLVNFNMSTTQSYKKNAHQIELIFFSLGWQVLDLTQNHCLIEFYEQFMSHWTITCMPYMWAQYCPTTISFLVFFIAIPKLRNCNWRYATMSISISVHMKINQSCVQKFPLLIDILVQKCLICFAQ